MDIESVFYKFDDEFLKFDRVENKRCNRPDLHAFLLLDALVPGKADILVSATYDEVYLSIEVEDLAKVATEEQIQELVRCGVRYDEDGLCMFV